MAALWSMVLSGELYNSSYSLMRVQDLQVLALSCIYMWKKLYLKMGQLKWEFRLWSLHILTKLYNTWDLLRTEGSFNYVWKKMGGALWRRPLMGGTSSASILAEVSLMSHQCQLILSKVQSESSKIELFLAAQWKVISQSLGQKSSL